MTINPKDVKAIVDGYTKQLEFNHEIMSIFQGNLTHYIKCELQKQMSPETFAQICARLAPINILPKVIDKLTNIYQTPVIRTVTSGTEKDDNILDYYEEKMRINVSMDASNEIYNLANGNCLIQPYVHKGIPKLRVISPDAFVPYSDDPADPTTPTDIILIYCNPDKSKYFWVYGSNYMYCCNEAGDILGDKMAAIGMTDTSNPIETLPFVYVNSSRYSISPCPDEDGIKIIKLLPIMLSDLNYAAMFQSFAILYGINVNDENLKMAPNAFWRFKSEATSDAKPEIGVLKPTVDYTQVLSLIESELSMWLGTKGIRASAIGSRVNAENFASGISKIIDEMDTYEAREKQVKQFQQAEEQLWDLVLHKLNPYWIATGQIENIGEFTPTASVATKFTTQLPLQTRGQVVADLQLEVEAGFTSRRRAIQVINPDLTDDEIDELIKEIDEERPTITTGVGSNGMAKTNTDNTQGSGSGTEGAASGSDY